MRDLHQERGGPAEQEKALAIDAASDAVGREDPGVSHPASVGLALLARYAVRVNLIDGDRNACGLIWYTLVGSMATQAWPSWAAK